MTPLLAILSSPAGHDAVARPLGVAIGAGCLASALLLGRELLRGADESPRRFSRGIVRGLAAFAALAGAGALATALGLDVRDGLRLTLGAGQAVAAWAVAGGLAARAWRARGGSAPAAGAAGAGTASPAADLESLQEALDRARRDARWLQLFASRTEEGMIVTDARRRIEWVNEGFTRITGYEPAEVVGRIPGALLQGPGSDPSVRAFMGQRLRAEKPVRAEILNYAKSGRPYWAAMEIQPLFDAEGRLVNFLSVQTDVTERKRAERRLEAEYAVMRILGDCTRLDEASPHLLATIGRTLDFDVVAFWTWDRQARAPKPAGRPWISARLEAVGAGEAQAAALAASLVGPMERVWTSGAPAWVSEIAPDRPDEAEAAAPRARLALRSAVIVPVADSEKSALIGVLVLFSREPLARDEPLLQVLTTLGRQIGMFAERRKAVREQVEINARLNAMLDASTQSSILAVDPGGVITIFNTGAERMLGYAAGEMVGRSTPLILHDPAEVAGRAAELAAESGRPVQGFEALVARARRDGHDVREWTYIRKNGERIAVLLAVTAVRDPEGSLRGFLTIATDLSQRQAAERQVRSSEARLRRLVEANIFGVAFGEMTGALTDANDGFLDMLGYSRDDLIDGGVHWLNLVADTSTRWVRRCRVQLAKHGSCPPFEIVVRRKDGRTLPILLGLARLDEARTDARAPIVAFCLDLTERKALEDELRRHAADLAEADHRKNQFIAMLGHELRNPLAPIRNAVRILKQRGGDDPDLAWASDVIERQVGQLSHLVGDLLEIARVNRGKIRLQLSPTDVAAVVSAAVETSRPEIDAHRHRLTIAIPPAKTLVMADPIRMAQVLSNLLHNAAKYTDDGGTIRLSASVEGDRAVFRVRDDGIGIPAPMLDRVFDVFTQVDRTLDRSEGGLGLGLTLVRSLVEMHEGTVEARSEGLGLGSEFIVRLPIWMGQPAAEPDDAGDAADVAGPPAPATASTSPRRILVVDDNIGSAQSLAMILQYEGHEVQVAHDGPTALQIICSRAFDVVFMDIGLPGMDGYEVARNLRARAELAALPLVAVTGYAEDEARRLSHEVGFDHHLVKPVDPDAILAVVASLEWAEDAPADAVPGSLRNSASFAGEAE
ncbi:PAS domain S-box protein [Paludisphaera mucosa]|uniref:histidine kinase n=1 Tax=Paludisphaera mucosa TaxID=3030827 RepID=A0ABT6FIE4_9BACT|nr:PAS domain S-box protein [Paludisphaera mucosa]MDG3007357.1 PAS domain S-box protein [Paludisphaera mucosa]